MNEHRLQECNADRHSDNTLLSSAAEMVTPPRLPETLVVDPFRKLFGRDAPRSHCSVEVHATRPGRPLVLSSHQRTSVLVAICPQSLKPNSTLRTLDRHRKQLLSSDLRRNERTNTFDQSSDELRCCVDAACLCFITSLSLHCLAHATKPLFVTVWIGLVVCRVPHKSQSPVGLVEFAATLRVGPLAIRKDNVAWCGTFCL